MALSLRIDPEHANPIFQQVVDGIERWILTGELKPGEYLPSVRELAVSQQINPNTVAKAFLVLQSRGLVESVRGKGLVARPLRADWKESRRNALLAEKAAELIALARQLDFTHRELVALVNKLGGDSKYGA